MTEQDYLQKCNRTMNRNVNADVELHCAIGIATESGEILDAYKKARFYGRELNVVNVKEEIGDCLYYLQVLCGEIGYTLEQAKIDNITKLEKRYAKNMFEDVIVRDTNTELSHI